MRKIYFLLLTVLFAAMTNAQLTGTKNIPGDYASLDAAITDLNTQGVGAGGVILNLLAGNPQTAPAGGYAITATGTLANPITIQGNGNTITASSALVAGNLNDAIFKIIGGDYITLQDFVMQENPANTTTVAATNNMTEWGVALLYATTTNGAQNNTIQNNMISLNRAYSNTFGLYSNVRHSATDVITTAEATTASGSNSGNKVYGNAISNVNFGMVFIGSSIAAAMDNMNDIGGSSSQTGNSITNWGGWVSGAPSGYNSLVAACAGITMVHQINENVSFNTLISATNITTLTTTGFIGIHKGYFFGQPSGTITADYNSNTVTLTNAPTTSQMTGMGLQGLTPLSTATFNCNNNNIINCAITGATATTSILVGMLHSAAPGIFNVIGNTIRGLTTTATTGGVIGIQHQTNAVGTALNINNNKIGDATAGAVTFVNATAQSGAFTGIAVTSTGAASTCALSISNNDFRGILHTALGSGANTYITNAAPAGSQTISHNTFTNLSINSTGSVTFINNTNTLPANGVKNVHNNSIVTGFAKTGAGGTVTFFIDNATDPSTATNNTTNNIFSNITITGATSVVGIQNTNGGSPIKNVIGNTVSNISGGTTGTITAMSINFDGGTTTVRSNNVNNITNGGPITGILFGTSGAGITNASLNTVHTLSGSGTGAVTGITLGGTSTTTRNLFRNKIYNLENTNAAGSVNGILISSGALAHNVYNNLIGDLRTPAVSAVNALNGINITSVTTLTNINIYFNTIFLNATSTGANFGSSGIFHTTSTTSTTANLTLRNNIIVNNSTPNGTGFTVAYRRSSTTLTNYNNASDRNLFYAGTPGPTRLIFYDGTNADQTLAAFQTRVAPREANSVTENPPFLSTSGASPDFLHINASIPTQAQGGAAPISGIVDDFDGDLRNPTTPDIGADEFTACTGAVGGTATGSASFCGPGTPTITASGYSTGPGSTYQWMSSTNPANYPAAGSSVTGQTNPASLTTGVVTTTTYYWLRVTCTSGTATAYSNMITVTIIPSAAAITAPTTTICEGQSVTLTETGGTATSWLWSPGGETTQSIIVSPTTTTTYSVAATSPGPCVANANITINVNPVPAGVTASASSNNICAGTAIDLFSTVNPGVPPTILTQNFESGLGSWTIVNTSSGGTNPAAVAWTIRPTGYTYSTDVFTGAGGSQFIMANSDAGGSGISANTTLTSPSFSTVGYSTLNLNFRHYYRHLSTAAFVEISTNGGTTWTLLQSYSATTGTAAAFASASLNLNAYTGFSNVMIRFRYTTGWDWYWAVDDISLTGTPVPFTFSWTSNPAGFTSNLQNPTGVTPTVTTTYTVTVTGIGGCTSSASTTVNVGTPDVSGSVVQPSTCVSTDGSITLTVSGGSGGPYTYAWTGPGVNPTSQNQTNLTVGTYTVTVTDVPSGCTTFSVFNLDGPGGCNLCPTIPNLTTTPSGSTCTGQSTTITASGLTDMGITYGIIFKYSATALPDPYTGGTVIATIPNSGLGSGGTVASTNTTFSATGTYIIYAILSPLPIDPACRPFAQVNLNVNSAPTVVCPANITVSTDPGQCGAIVNYPAATVTGVPTPAVTYSHPSGSFFPRGTTTVTVTATNSCGTATCTFTVTVNDTQPPVINCPANITTGNTPGLCGANVNYTVSASDNCPGVTTTLLSGPASGAFFPLGTTTVTWRATDASGNTSTCSFTVTVNDTQPPAITCPANITVNNTPGQCGAVVNFSVVASDNCPLTGTTPITLSQNTSTNVVAGSVSCNSGGFHTDNSYYRVFNLSAMGLPGPVTINQVRFGIELADAVSGAQPVTVRLHTLNGTFTLANLTLIGSQTYSIPNQTLSLFTATLSTPVVVQNTATLVLEIFTPAGTGNRFFIGSNGLGQSAPSYILAAPCGVTQPTTLASLGFPNMHIVLQALGTVTPAGSGVVSVPASGSFFPVGTTTVVSTATDAAGNTSTCSFTVTVVDNQPPAITCPANITVNTPIGSCTAVVNYNVTATDNCPGVTTALVSGLASGSAFPLGVTTVRWRATDASGNTSTCQFTVTVNDAQIPVISSQPANTSVCVGSNATFTVVAAPLGGPNNLTYQWQQWTGTAFTNIAGATSATLTVPNVTLAMNGNTYRVLINGLCTQIISGLATLNVRTLPNVSLSTSRSPALTPGQLLTIMASVSPTGGTIAWYKNGVLIPSALTLSLNNLTVDDVGTYHAVYTAPNGCTATSQNVVVSKASSTNVFIYPNPSDGRFQVRVYNQNEPITVTVYNSKGSMVYQRTTTTSVPYTRMDVDLSHAASGQYVVDVRGAGGNRLGAKQIVIWR